MDHVYLISKKIPCIDEEGVDTPKIEHICTVETETEAINMTSKFLMNTIEQDVSPVPSSCTYSFIREMLEKSRYDDCSISVKFNDKYLTISANANGIGYYATAHCYTAYDITEVPFLQM